jgi:uncharacterized membrane protein HdeD (DUF308 family)
MNTQQPESFINQLAEENFRMVIILGIATVVAGFLATIAPLLTGQWVAIMVAILLIAAGIARTIFAFKAESWGKGILAFLLGILTVFAGLILLANPMMALATLTLMLTAFFFADGIIEVITAFRLKPLQGWGWMALSGVMSIVLGFMLARQWPLSSLWAIGILLGVRLLFTGWSIIAIGMAGNIIMEKAAQIEIAADSTEQKPADHPTEQENDSHINR